MQSKKPSERRRQEVRNYFAHRSAGRWADVVSGSVVIEVKKHVRMATPLKATVTIETKVTRANRQKLTHLRDQMRLPGLDEPVTKGASPPKLSRPPGAMLLAFGEFVFSKKDFERVLQPTIADMRTEYYEALAEGRYLKARWIEFRDTSAFLLAAFAVVVGAIIRLVSFWKAAS